MVMFGNLSPQKFLLSLSCCSVLLATPVLAQEQILKTITVTGQGIEKIPVSIATVQLAVEIEGKEATEVQQQVAQRTSSLIQLLEQNNQVSRLQTTGITLRPNYTYNNNQRRLIGYTGNNSVSFETSIPAVGKILDQSVNIGATRIDNLSLTATPQAIEQARGRALVKASQNAQQQAQTVLNALNLTAQEIVTININSASAPRPMMMQSKEAFSSALADTPVVGGEQDISASVTLQIRY